MNVKEKKIIKLVKCYEKKKMERKISGLREMESKL